MNAKKMMLVLAAAAAASVSASADLFEDFRNPPEDSKPWCYWLWQNSNVDEECIVKDLENIRFLGFGGVLFSDTRGYGQHRVNTPPERYKVYSPEWYRLFELALKTADRLGLKFTMNVSTSGGTLKGPWPTGADAPKQLLCGVGGAERPSDYVGYRDIADFAVKVANGESVSNCWKNAGGVVDRWTLDSGDIYRPALEWREIPIGAALPADDAAGRWMRLKFGYSMIEGRECDVDVIDSGAVRRHLDRLAGPILQIAGDMTGRTLSHFYSVSWEGAVPTWTPAIEKEFAKRAGYDLRAELPALAGWRREGGRPAMDVMRDYRTVRNDMFKDNFYGTFRDYCHENGMQIYSESGGPWNRGESVFKYADQLEFLAVNDMPQGEFWIIAPDHHTGGPHHNRPAAACARLYGKKRASAEAFTHMDFHWSIAPSQIKECGDQAFADGINHLVWHTYTASPADQGIPGLEYFAGTHINRNVTWNFEAPAVIAYLARCQYLLQWGKPVMDIALYGGDNVYSHWDSPADRTRPWDDAPFVVPRGYTYDIVNKDVMDHRAKRDGEGIVLPDGARYRKFVDASGESVALGPLPPRDCEGPFRNVHRTDGKTDVYFLSGEGRADVVFAVSMNGRKVELWDALTAKRTVAAAEALADGRTRVPVDLPKAGSVFVVFTSEGGAIETAETAVGRIEAVKGPWNVSFAYHPGITQAPPAPVVWNSLHYFTLDPNRDPLTGIRGFSGTATMRTTFTRPKGNGKVLLNVGEVASGVAHVYVNGGDCGLVWCAPWRTDITGALKDGENGLVLKVTTTWYNRLVTDVMSPQSQRVTRSCVNFFKEYRDNHWTRYCSGYCKGDKHRHSGLNAPVLLETVP